MATYSVIKKDSLVKTNLIIMGESLIITGIITHSLKIIINRKRPYKTYPEIEKLSNGASPSFPSGHTSEAFSFATSLSLLYPKYYIIVSSFTWACAVAYSRVDLGVHYPSDVLAGAIIGAGSAYFSRWINNKIIEKHIKHVKIVD